MRKHLIANEGIRSEIPGPFVFLGGTVGDTTWRMELIGKLAVDFFNPVVENWTEDDIAREDQAKAAADVALYVITPKQHGYYVIAETVAAVYEAHYKKVVIVFLDNDAGTSFTEHQISSNAAIKELLLKRPDVEFFENIDDTAAFLNGYLAVADNKS